MKISKKDFSKFLVFWDTSIIGFKHGTKVSHWLLWYIDTSTGELGYDRPLYDRFLHMTDEMLDPSPMHIKYLSYV